MTSIRERLKMFIKSQRLTVQQFEKSCGFSNAYVNSIGRMPGADKLETIVRVYPNLNREWLLTGDGEMLLDSEGVRTSETPVEPSPTVSELLSIIRSQQETIKTLSETVRELTISKNPS